MGLGSATLGLEWDAGPLHVNFPVKTELKSIVVIITLIFSREKFLVGLQGLKPTTCGNTAQH
jgi:hypothetical protein